MQTFLPDPDFGRTALLLDRRRLGKQRVEALQVLRGLTVPGYGWRRHPAVRMWVGYEEALVRYGLEICRVWRDQGHQDSCAASLVSGLAAHRPGPVRGQEIPWGAAPLYIKYHKPVGVTTTSESHVPRNIIAEIGHPERIFPIGRLDKDSSGLILLTNDGDIVNEILRTEHGHEREYEVSVDHPYDQMFIDSMTQGVVILERPTKPCRIERIGPARFRIILTEGRNRQIRRMCQVLGYQVRTLHRVRIVHITLDGLAPGEWKPLTGEERERLFRAVGRGSSQGDTRGRVTNEDTEQIRQ